MDRLPHAAAIIEFGRLNSFVIAVNCSPTAGRLSGYANKLKNIEQRMERQQGRLVPPRREWLLGRVWLPWTPVLAERLVSKYLDHFRLSFLFPSLSLGDELRAMRNDLSEAKNNAAEKTVQM